MSGRVHLAERDDDLVAVKVAAPDEVAQLEREADLLQRARHPGVVEVVGLERSADGSASLLTRFAGGHSLATVTLGSADHVAAVVAAVATTLADLHRLGVVHGRVAADHVLLDQRARPVLCGPSGEGTPADDVFALGELLAGLLGRDVDAEPIPDRRLGLRIRQRRWRGYRERGLLNLADQARADDPHRRPSARALATAIHELVPEASLPHLDRTDPRRPTDRPELEATVGFDAAALVADEPRRPLGWRLLALAVAGVALCAAGVATLVDHSDERPPVDAAPSTGAGFACAGNDRGDLDVDINGDGCPDELEIGEGIVAAAGQRWSVGHPDDQLAVGDWDCDGVATPALLRQATGEVFVFDRWAGDDDVATTATSVVADAAAIEAVAVERGPSNVLRCHEVHVVDEAGTTHPLVGGS
jgi:hypothetical protein